MSYLIPSNVMPLVREVQRNLLAAGFSPGPIDGKPGVSTFNAMQSALDELRAMRGAPVGVGKIEGHAMTIKDAGLTFRGTLKPVNPDAIRHVVIHHTANSNPKWGVKECHESHLNRGWIGIGYNYFLEQDGMIYYGRSDVKRDYIGAHVAGYNSTSIGICLDGNYSMHVPTAKNLDQTARITAYILRRYNLSAMAIRYHCELQAKDCPGRNFPSRLDFAKLVSKHI